MFAIILSVATLGSYLYSILAFHIQLQKLDLRAEIQYVGLGTMRSR